MKKRISALFIAILMVMFCLPISVSAEETSTKTPETVGGYEGADDLARWGIGEEYAIVPCNAGTSAVDLNGSNGTDITIHKSHRKVNQRWTLGKVGEYYYFKNKWNGKVIDVSDSNAVSGQALQGNTYNGTDSQLWKLESMGDGTYSIQNKLNDSLVWDVQGSTWNNGAKITLFTQHKASNQRFRFVHVSTVEPMSDWGSERQDCSGSDWSVWDGAKNTNWYNSKETDQYINSAADLGGLISLVMNDYDMNGKTIHLMCDIDLAGINWTPIGFKDHWFRGSFNGHNHAIIGLSNTNNDDCAALFGRVKGGTICNLAVKGTIKGNYQVAGIVALLEEGHIVNVYSEVSVINATNYREGGIAGAVAYGGFIDHCTQNAPVYSNEHYSHRGGIAGYSDGTIRYCVNNATVNNNRSCGGIAGTVGSGIYVARSCTIGVSGVMVIRGNDGEGSMDNLVLGSNALIYNHGLNPGSEIHLRSTFDGNVKLGGSLMSEYQLREYFRSDYGRLELTDIETVNTELRASIFSSGKTGLIIGAVIMAAVALGGLFYIRRKRKGETP